VRNGKAVSAGVYNPVGFPVRVTSSSRVEGSSTPLSAVAFGPFELDAAAGELRRDGVPVRLQPQPFKVLAVLVERAGQLVTREELKKALWGEETYVDFERGLNFCINQVRVALGDSAESPVYVQTLPRRGYRFVAAVGHVGENGNTGSPAEPLPTMGVKPETLVPTWQALTAGIAFLALLVAAASFLAQRATAPATPTTTRTMIAVLPLEDLTGAEPPPWFADGLTDELITQIGRVSPGRLGVIARTSAMTYRGTSKNIAEIGRELGVSHILEGSLRREGNRLRITVQLVGVFDQAPVWSQTYDRTAHGALTIQSEVAAEVTRALALELLAEPWATPTWAGTRNPEARDAYLQGKYFSSRGTSADLRSALQQFGAAAELDPRFAAAHAAQADTYHRLAMFGLMRATDAYPRATTSAREAIRLDPNLGDSHAAMGIVHLWAEWNPRAAAESFERAVALNPSDALAHHDYAWALVALERFDDAVAHITRARDLDPVSPRANNDIGWLYLQTRQPSEALRACRQALAIDPDSIEAQQCLERAHLQRGELTDAVAAARIVASRGPAPVPALFIDPSTPENQIRALWQWRLDRVLAAARERYVNPYTIAMHHAVLGDDAAALASLEQALAEHVGVMVLLPTDPVFDRLRGNPRFITLVEAVRRD
jgi:TolB-like protein/DNA-binding winged helix-turn-helix (wHTH) protein/Tfp pilus assembly protein PilF